MQKLIFELLFLASVFALTYVVVGFAFSVPVGQ